MHLRLIVVVRLLCLCHFLSFMMPCNLNLNENLLSEIDENSTGIMEDIENCKNNALERKRILEEQKESFQKAAFSVLDMLNDKDIGYN